MPEDRGVPNTPTPLTTPTLRLRLAGTPALRWADGRERVLERRAAALLALVALEPGVTRARAAQWLWPDATQARQALRQQLQRFRHWAEADLVVGDPVLQLAPAVQLDDPEQDTDTPSITTAHPHPAELLHGLDFSDCADFDAWLHRQRQQRRQRSRSTRQQALQQALVAAEGEQDWAQALALAEAAWAEEPGRESAALDLMRLHYRRGEVAPALAVLSALEQALQRDTPGRRPGAAVRALERLLHEAESADAAPLPWSPQAERLAGVLPLALQRPPQLLGRAAEMQALHTAWQQRTAALVIGEAGIGKSRLLDDFARRQALPALRAAARPGDVRLPYALLARVVRDALRVLPEALPSALQTELARLLPELGEAAPRGPDAQQIRLFDAVRAVLGRAAAAGIEALLLDDLHHADAASLEALRHAAAAPLELAWIVASRPVAADGASAGNGPGPGAWAELRATLAQLPQACEIGLMPLGVADVAQLVGTLAPDRLPRPGQAEGEGSAHELATRLVARTAGNPLFVLASLQAHWLGRAGQAGALPGLDSMASVSALMAQRLQTLSAPALALARCAAVAGQDFNAELAAAVLGEKPLALADAWAELQRAGVFGRNGFAHELIQEAARLTLPAPVAAALHAAVAERLLVEGQGKAERPARVAYHFEQTDRAERAAPHWHAAGHAAWARLRFAEATDCFEHAAQRHGQAGRVDAAYESAHAMRLASFEVDLGERSQTAVELLERYAHTPEQRGQAANERAVTLLHRGDLAGCEAAAHAGLLALGQAEAPLVRAELRRNVAAVALWRQQPGVALAELRAIEADVERAGDVTLRAHVRQSLSIVLDHCDQVDAAQEEGERAAALFLQAGHITSAAQVVANLAVIHHDTGRLAAAWAALERARSLVAGLPEAQRSYSSLNLNSGYVLTGLGEYERALGFLDEALAHAQRQTPGWLPLMLAWRAQLWLHLGLAERAQQDLASAEFDARTPPLARAKWLGLKAQLALVLHGRDASTLAALDDFATTLPAGGRRLSAWRLATAALPHRDDESAITHGRALLAELQGKKRFGLEMVVHAELAARLADTPRTARDHALAALALLDDGCLPDNSYRGRIWCQCLPLVREADPEGHATRLNAARAWIERSAAHTVPAMAVQAFLHRNPANQSLRSAAFGR